jgi:hypothetical protein
MAVFSVAKYSFVFVSMKAERYRSVPDIDQGHIVVFIAQMSGLSFLDSCTLHAARCPWTPITGPVLLNC